MIPAVLSDTALKDALDASPSPNRVTPEYMQSRIAETEFYGPDVLGGTITLCKITLDNGFTATGQSACADPANYKRETGEKIAFDNAFATLWPLFGFLLKEKLWLDSQH